MSDRIEYPLCFGPYLRYAISTEFRDFAPFGEKSKLFFLVEFRYRGPPTDFETAMKPYAIQIGPANDDSPFSTLRADKEAVLDPAAFDSWNTYVKRVELSLPLSPTSTAPFSRTNLTHRYLDQPPARLLIGMMDDGCPFAAAQFLKVAADGSIITRVRGIWDQDDTRQPIAVNARSFGMRLLDFQVRPRILARPRHHRPNRSGRMEADACDTGRRHRRGQLLRRRPVYKARASAIAWRARDGCACRAYSDLVEDRPVLSRRRRPPRSAELDARRSLHRSGLRRRSGVRAVFRKLHQGRDRRLAQSLCYRRHQLRSFICRSELHRERDHQSQLRTHNRTARRHSRARGGIDRARHVLRRCSTTSRSSTSSCPQAIPI